LADSVPYNSGERKFNDVLICSAMFYQAVVTFLKRYKNKVNCVHFLLLVGRLFGVWNGKSHNTVQILQQWINHIP